MLVKSIWPSLGINFGCSFIIRLYQKFGNTPKCSLKALQAYPLLFVLSPG